MHPKPFVLIILDGYGYHEADQDNAINQARRPVWDRLWHNNPHTLISGSGTDVGLPRDQMGNSEVGHTHLGAGRVVHQELARIGKAIERGEFERNPALAHAVAQSIQHNSTLHIIGLLSPGGVHSHQEHLFAMVKMAVQKGVKNIAIHAFLDGRDTPPRSAEASLAAMQTLLSQHNAGRIASIVGRYYAMDRDQRWDRIEQAYDLLTQSKAKFTAHSATEALQMAYARGENDEFVQPTIIQPKAAIHDGDVVIFMNFRADRARQLTAAFVQPDFSGFQRKRYLKLADFVTLTKYKSGLVQHVAYPATQLKNMMGAVLAQHNLKQLRIAETEKYAHVTFFFNGGIEAPFPGEDRILVPSPQVTTYDLKPEMSAIELTDKLVSAIESSQYDAIICNYANADMVGHTGNMAATITAIETLDQCLDRIVTALKKTGGEALITADHGNAEKMRDHVTGQPHTAHTLNPVPLLYIGRPADVKTTKGTLSDVAPTMLSLMHITPPAEMTGQILFSTKNTL